MTVFKLIIRISVGKSAFMSIVYDMRVNVPRGVVDRVDEFLEPFSFRFQQKAGLLIPPTHIDVHLERQEGCNDVDTATADYLLAVTDLFT